MADLSENRVALFERNDKELSAYIYAYVEGERGDLVISGQDLGSAVRGAFGDTDYEYWLRIREADKAALLEALQAEFGESEKMPQDPDQQLLALVQANYSEYQAEVRLRAFCESRGIPCEFFSYS